MPILRAHDFVYKRSKKCFETKMKPFKNIFRKTTKEDPRIIHRVNEPGKLTNRQDEEIVAESYEACQNTPLRFLFKLIYRIAYFKELKIDFDE